ncbi:MAG: hypothetical protein ACJAVX_001088 [Pseudoalteromonas rhizosphaerae]|jgi:hypothetical protein
MTVLKQPYKTIGTVLALSLLIANVYSWGQGNEANFINGSNRQQLAEY